MPFFNFGQEKMTLAQTSKGHCNIPDKNVFY